jgi:hypothetical protein
MNYENLMGRVFQQSDSGKLTSSLVKEVGDLFALQELIESAKQYSYGEIRTKEFLDLIRQIFPVKNLK